MAERGVTGPQPGGQENRLVGHATEGKYGPQLWHCRHFIGQEPVASSGL